MEVMCYPAFWFHENVDMQLLGSVKFPRVGIMMQKLS